MYHVGVTAHLIQPSGFATRIFPENATLRFRQAFFELPENVKEFYGEKTIHSGTNIDVSLKSIKKWKINPFRNSIAIDILILIFWMLFKSAI